MGEIIVILICLVLNAVLAAYEMAFVSFSKPELLRAAKQGSKNAEAILNRRENPERTLSVIQIGITLVGTLAAAVGGAGAVEIIEPYFIHLGLSGLLTEALAILVVILPLTYLSVVFGELIPKTLALRKASKIAIRGAPWLLIADRMLSPAVSLLEWSTKKLINLFFPASKKIEDAADTTLELGSLSPIHRQYVLNLARIENRRIEDMIVAWTDVDTIKNSDSNEQVLSIILNSGHTRLPVLNKNGNVVGILHTKEFMNFRESKLHDWTSIIRSVPKVIVRDSALGTLRLMQANRNHMAIVYSESGIAKGILTLEDILEEIIGDIFDEDDDGRIQKIIASRTRAKRIL